MAYFNIITPAVQPYGMGIFNRRSNNTQNTSYRKCGTGCFAFPSPLHPSPAAAGDESGVADRDINVDVNVDIVEIVVVVADADGYGSLFSITGDIGPMYDCRFARPRRGRQVTFSTVCIICFC